MKTFLLLLGLLPLAAPCLADELPEIGRILGCDRCHALNHQVVGPAWLDIAKRYRSVRGDQAVVDKLIKKVSLGGQGNWGETPMVANDPTGKKRDQIEEAVRFILSLPESLATGSTLVSSKR